MTTTVLNTKIGEVKNKIPYTGCFVTATNLNTKIGEVENKIPDVSSLVTEIVYNAKISDIKEKYFTTSYYDKFTSEISLIS